jgi:transcriptional regulator with XRE-family HTH domain
MAPMLASQCKMARAALGLGVRELAELADLSPDTVSRFEAGEALKPRTTAAVRLAPGVCRRRVIAGRRRAASQGGRRTK